ncbi:MAG: hypothetical protein KatS3mg051_1087 [Anaerolineae bacterium]|nr:MAG: hypothetical protein KatS3mg051_1087 [Anaerolineae bacterium]
MSERYSSLARNLKPYIVRWIQDIIAATPGGGSGGGGSVLAGAPSPHGLASEHHSGTLTNDQAPQFALLDGSRIFTGNIVLNSGLTVDGVDLDVHVATPGAHHAAFVGLEDDAATAVSPAGDYRIQILGGDGLTSTAGANVLTLAVDNTVVRTSRTLTAGAGLTGGGDLSANRTFDVGAGDGIDVLADSVAVDVTDIIDTLAGLKEDASNNIQVNLDSAGGLEFNSGAVRVKLPTNHGLSRSSSGLALGTPSTLTVSSTNAVTSGTHTHDIDSTSNPGAAAKILQSDSAGALQLVRLGLGQAPNASYSLVAAGDVDIAGHLEAGSGDVLGALDVWEDLTVGPAYASPGVLFVDVSQQSVGVNRAPDPQFALDISGPARADWWVGPHALQLSDAEMIVHFDGPLPYNTDHSGTAVGHLGQVPVESGGIIYRPGKFQKAVQVAEGTTNLVLNPSFEVDLSSWATFNGTGGDLAAAQTTEDAWYGAACAKLTATAVSSSQFYSQISGTYNNGDTITASVWLRAASPTTAVFKVMRHSSPYTQYGATTCNISTEWQRFTVAATVTENGVPVRVNLFPQPGTIYVDGVQAEARAYPTPYCDGSLGPGHSWTGTAHNSTSTRTGAVLKYPITDPVFQRTGTIAAWVRLAVPLDGSLPGNGWNDYVVLQTAASENTDSTWLRWRNDNGYGQIRITSNGSARASAELNWGAYEWHHVAWTWDADANASAVYVDGAQVGAGTFAPFSQPPNLIHVNQNDRAGIDVDDLVLLRRAASADEIRAIYESNAPLFAESSVFGGRFPSRSPVWVDEEGLWVRSLAGNEAFGIYGGDATKSWGGRTLEPGDVLIGRVPNYIHWDDSAGTLDVAGILHVLDNSTFDGVITIGTSGGIWQGTGSFGSPTTGLKIYQSGGVGLVEMWGSGTRQAFMDTDGKLKAGGGNVVLDNAGIYVDGSGQIQIGSGNNYLLLDNTGFKTIAGSDAGIAGISYRSSPTSETGYFRQERATLGSKSAEVKYYGAKFGFDSYVQLVEQASTPASPTSRDKANIYVKSDKLVVQWNDNGTIRYKYLDLNGTGVTWTHTTTAP